MAGVVFAAPNTYLIHELNQSKLDYGTYETMGYVSDVYTCPVCEAGQECEACQPDHIVISEEKTLLAKYALTDNELIVFVDDPALFEVGKEYRFLIRILDAKTMDQPLNNIKLIHHEEIIK